MRRILAVGVAAVLLLAGCVGEEVGLEGRVVELERQVGDLEAYSEYLACAADGDLALAAETEDVIFSVFLWFAGGEDAPTLQEVEGEYEAAYDRYDAERDRCWADYQGE